MSLTLRSLLRTSVTSSALRLLLLPSVCFSLYRGKRRRRRGCESYPEVTAEDLCEVICSAFASPMSLLQFMQGEVVWNGRCDSYPKWSLLRTSVTSSALRLLLLPISLLQFVQGKGEKEGCDSYPEVIVKDLC